MSPSPRRRTTVTSTVPGAVAVLQRHFEAVAKTEPKLAPAVYIGLPVERVADSYLLIGDEETGSLLASYSMKFTSAVAANRHSEEYGILCALRVWAGDTNQLARLTDAFRLLAGVTTALQNDPGGSGQLTPSGTWQVSEVTVPVNAPFGDPVGFGVVLAFIVQVINVRLTS